MKTKLKYICLSAAAGLTLSLSSCSDFMDLTPEDQYDEATVWSDADLAKTVVNDVYSYVCDIAQEVNPDAWTDDAFFTHVYGCRQRLPSFPHGGQIPPQTPASGKKFSDLNKRQYKKLCP